MKIKGLIISRPHDIQWHNYDVPLTLEQYVDVEILACGICTWEQRVFRGAKCTYPFWGGHEVCGKVKDIIDCKVSGLKIGDRVSIALMSRCGNCRLCKIGLDNHCAYLHKAAEDGLPQGPRGFSSRMIVPAYKVFRLPSHLSPEIGTLVEPIACSLRSIQKSKLSSNGTAVVVGAGTMGLIHTLILNIMGHKVIMCDDNFSRLDSAACFGANLTLPLSDAGLQSNILQTTQGFGVDAVFCIRGGTFTIEKGINLVRRGGTVVLFQSILKQDEPVADILKISANDIHYREISLIGSIGQTLRDFKEAVNILSNNPEMFRPLVSKVCTEANAAFKSALDPENNRVVFAFS